LAGLAVVFIEDGNGLLPGGALGVVDLAQIEDVSLHHAAPDAAALDDGPGAMLLAVLLPRAALEKHATSIAKARATSQANACINNLRQIDGAAQQWALERGQSDWCDHHLSRGPDALHQAELVRQRSSVSGWRQL
jgi:hypothetical protein